jgi:hypothetical protein
MGVHLIRGHLMGIHLIGVYLVSGCPVGVYLRGVQLSGRNYCPAEITAELAALILPYISNHLNTTNYIYKLNIEL